MWVKYVTRTQKRFLAQLKIMYLQGFLAKIRVSQLFWDPIKNRVSQRSVLLKAVYLEALLYIIPCYLENCVVREPCKQRTDCIVCRKFLN